MSFGESSGLFKWCECLECCPSEWRTSLYVDRCIAVLFINRPWRGKFWTVHVMLLVVKTAFHLEQYWCSSGKNGDRVYWRFGETQ